MTESVGTESVKTVASSNGKFSITGSQKDMKMFSSIKSYAEQSVTKTSPKTAQKPPLAAKSPIKQFGRKINSTIDVNNPLE